jgi:hypothetical protein
MKMDAQIDLIMEEVINNLGEVNWDTITEAQTLDILVLVMRAVERTYRSGSVPVVDGEHPKKALALAVLRAIVKKKIVNQAVEDKVLFMLDNVLPYAIDTIIAAANGLLFGRCCPFPFNCSFS